MPNRETLRQNLVEILTAETGEAPAAVGDEVGLREGLGLDSVDFVSLVMQIEGQYRIRLSSEELATVHTIGDFLNMLEARLAATPPQAMAA